MKTAKGNTYTTLLNIGIHEGYLTTGFTVPMTLGDVNNEYITKMIPHLNDRITTEKKPGGTYEKCLLRIEHHKQQLQEAYVQLIETYQRDINPVKTRTSSADKARRDMLNKMDNKMLKQFSVMYIQDKVNDYILPGEKQALIEVVLVAMKDVDSNGGGE